jgi:hypothetical protein
VVIPQGMSEGIAFEKRADPPTVLYQRPYVDVWLVQEFLATRRQR